MIRVEKLHLVCDSLHDAKERSFFRKYNKLHDIYNLSRSKVHKIVKKY